MYMSKTVLFTVLTVTVLQLVTGDVIGQYQVEEDSAVTDWLRWKQAFNKVYYTYEEEAEKFMIFSENRERVRLHNELFEDRLNTYVADLNFFSDLTPTQFEVMMSGAIPVTSHGRYTIAAPENTPEHMDWRNYGFVTSVKNQKNCNCPTCFAVTGSLEALYFIRSKGTLETLSAQQLLDCAPQQNCCMGGSMVDAMEYLKENKIVHARSYPWQAEQKQCRIDGKQGLTSIRGYHVLESGNERNLKYAVAMMGPVAVNFKFSRDLQFYSGGVFFDHKCNSNVYERNFDALIIGYGTDSNLGPYWTVKFSWGPEYGEKGYVRIYRMVNHCDIASAPVIPFY